ncbi:MAG: ABC transporter permease [Flavobacteriales bacterium]|nr:ABC transporter permease [Flavobacteriales bacterium]MCB9190815.1 ABC transporter permease [Flavobacteriales bacterium]
MNLSFLIARRYLFSKKSHNAINIISAISVAGVAVVTAAMVIVLSVFNGFEGLVISLYNVFEAPVVIRPAEGKTLELSTIPTDKILETEGVIGIVEVLEESCLLRYRDKQYFARIKGVSDNFNELTDIDTMIIDGDAAMHVNGTPSAMIGSGVAYHLSVNVNDPINTIQVYVPKRGSSATIDPSKAFNVKQLFATGVFSIQADFDLKYMITPISFARDLLDHEGRVSSLELALDPKANMAEVRESLQETLGSAYVVKDRYQQNELLYKIMKSEKWAVFMILSFILMISIFNVIGSLTMLILEKKKDINILRSMGASEELIQRIFILEGIFISMIGAVGGLVLGLLVCYAQIQFELVKLSSGGNYIVQAYPVEVQPMDVLYVFHVVATIGLLAAWLPVRKIIKPVETLRIVQE